MLMTWDSKNVLFIYLKAQMYNRGSFICGKYKNDQKAILAWHDSLNV